MRLACLPVATFLLLPALLLAGCLGDGSAPAPTVAADPEEDELALDGPVGPPKPLPGPVCENKTIFAYYQNGTWSDRSYQMDLHVPAGTMNMTLELAIGTHAVIEYEAAIRDPNGDTWYEVRYAGHDLPMTQGSVLKEGDWGSVTNATPVPGDHTFTLRHQGPVQDLQYLLQGEVCSEGAVTA